MVLYGYFCTCMQSTCCPAMLPRARAEIIKPLQIQALLMLNLMCPLAFNTIHGRSLPISCRASVRYLLPVLYFRQAVCQSLLS